MKTKTSKGENPNNYPNHPLYILWSMIQVLLVILLTLQSYVVLRDKTVEMIRQDNVEQRN
jgi:hypothetical protein